MAEKIKAKRKIVQPTQLMLNILLIALFIIGLYPLFMALFGSFKNYDQYVYFKYIPTLPLRLENIGEAFDRVYEYMGRTILVAVAATAFMVFFSTMSGFAIAKLKFPGSQILVWVILGVNMLPGVLTLVPTVNLYHSLGLYNNIIALIVGPAFSTSTAFLMYSTFRGLPNSIFEAAEIDGANDFQKYVMIAIPLAVPLIATLVIMQVSGTFGDFAWPMLILRSENYTVAAGLKADFSSATGQQMPVAFAAYLIASTPLILLFFFMNRFYVEGIVASGLKL